VGVLQTGENQVQGTPAFMAPEQAMGMDIDARADIYATGCLAYWLLTGEFVFAAETPMGHILHHAQTLPSPSSARTGRPIPAGLDELVLACLAKDPADRPQTARELSRRLGQLAEAEGWSQERARDWWLAHQVATMSVL
jgi:serine/threonine protein kinase